MEDVVEVVMVVWKCWRGEEVEEEVVEEEEEVVMVVWKWWYGNGGGEKGWKRSLWWRW